MRVFWSKRATSDLKGIVQYIERDKPDAAVRVAKRIYDEVMELSSMPYRGTPGKIEGTHHLMFHPWPYIVIYRVMPREIRILRIRHGAQNQR